MAQEGGTSMALTYFFRDLGTLELAVNHLLQCAEGRSKVRIWDAGCAMGMEPYTLAILLAERMSPASFANLEIHASDYDPPLLEVVRHATYETEELERVPSHLFARYFEPVVGDKGRFRVCELVRRVLHIHRHDLLSFQTIRTGFSLVVCKNVLLHFHHDDRVRIIRMFHQALEPGGLLAMEHTQKLPQELATMFQQVGAVDQVFRKVALP